MSEDSTNGGGTQKRPTFLTVLCILSFIGIGFAVIGSVITIATYSAVDTELLTEGMDDMSGMMEEAGETSGFMDMIFSSAAASLEHARTLAVIQLIAALLCLFGVLRMWKLRKTGFYVYTVGNLAYPIAGIVLVGGIMATGLLFPVIFIILYGLNLKHMN